MLPPSRGYRGRSTQDDAWRALLATLAPEIADLPASMQAVNLLLIHRHPLAARAACAEWVASGTPALRDLLALSDRFKQSGDLESAIHHRRLAYEQEMRELGLQGEELDETIGFCLSADGFGDANAAPCQGYFRAMFDQYAKSFEARLVEQLDYCGPAVVHRLLRSQLKSDFHQRRILDLGCGTGLAGPLFRPHAVQLDGLDFSSKMIAEAQSKDVYDKLWVGDLLDSLERCTAKYDLLLAIDVLIYFRELSPFFRACRRVLGCNGMLAVSIETGQDDYQLANCRRFRHSLDYLREQATGARLEVSHTEPVSLRKERNQPVCGAVVLLKPIDQ